MKKIISVIILVFLLITISPIVFAQDESTDGASTEKAAGTDSKTETETGAETGTGSENGSNGSVQPPVQPPGSTFGLEEVQGTPKDLTIPGILATIADMLIGMAGFYLVVMLIYGGIVYLTSAGNEKRVETGKNVITYAIIGIVIVFASYLVAQFVIQAVAPVTQ